VHTTAPAEAQKGAISDGSPIQSGAKAEPTTFQTITNKIISGATKSATLLGEHLASGVVDNLTKRYTKRMRDNYAHDINDEILTIKEAPAA